MTPHHLIQHLEVHCLGCIAILLLIGSEPCVVALSEGESHALPWKCKLRTGNSKQDVYSRTGGFDAVCLGTNVGQLACFLPPFDSTSLTQLVQAGPRNETGIIAQRGRRNPRTYASSYDRKYLPSSRFQVHRHSGPFCSPAATKLTRQDANEAFTPTGDHCTLVDLGISEWLYVGWHRGGERLASVHDADPGA